MEEKNQQKEIDDKFKEFFNYLKIGLFIGVTFGLILGWMWGLKGLLYGPLIGVGFGIALAIIFTVHKGSMLAPNNGSED